MIIGVVKETYAGERRVALVPAALANLTKLGGEIRVQTGAGAAAGFSDDAYRQAGATIVEDRAEVLRSAEVVCQVRAHGANQEAGRDDLSCFSDRTTIIGLAEPLTAREPLEELAQTGARSFALELMPRITRAQSMDVLSSQATVQGYKAVVLAAMHLPRMFPMMMTAAGTLAPARVFVIGAGVAGLGAIATARRLGGVVSAYDIRAAVKEQVESLGAAFVELQLETGSSEDKGGYAKAMDDEFYRRQQDMMTQAVVGSDVVVTTAAVPGKTSPILVTAEMVRGMAPGSVIVDLAAERGGNCELTRADEEVLEQGVTILGPTNLASTVPFHASQMFARNVTSFLQHLISDGELQVDRDDEITQQTLLTENGVIVHARVRQLLGIDEPEAATTTSEAGSEA